MLLLGSLEFDSYRCSRFNGLFFSLPRNESGLFLLLDRLLERIRNLIDTVPTSEDRKICGQPIDEVQSQ